MGTFTIIAIIIGLVIFILLFGVFSSVAYSANGISNNTSSKSNIFILPTNTTLTCYVTGSNPVSGYYTGSNGAAAYYKYTQSANATLVYTLKASSTLKFTQLVEYEEDSSGLTSVTLDVTAEDFYCYASLTSDSNVICKNGSTYLPNSSGFLGNYGICLNYSTTNGTSYFQTSGIITFVFTNS